MSANIISIDSTLSNSQRRVIVAEGLTNEQFDKVLEAKTLNAVSREEVKVYCGVYHGDDGDIMVVYLIWRYIMVTLNCIEIIKLLLGWASCGGVL